MIEPILAVIIAVGTLGLVVLAIVRVLESVKDSHMMMGAVIDGLNKRIAVLETAVKNGRGTT